jgi:methionyl-tRNA synthetase
MKMNTSAFVSFVREMTANARNIAHAYKIVYDKFGKHMSERQRGIVDELIKERFPTS